MIHQTELVCSSGCGYECATGNAVFGAFERATPRECPRCGGDLEAP